MSRAYRISVAESLSRQVRVEDGLCSSLELLPILEKGRMGELLAAELEQRGFGREGEVLVRKEKGGVTVKVDVKSGEVTVVAEGRADLKLETQRTAVVEKPDSPDREKALRAAAREQLNREAAAEEEALRRQVTTVLEGKLKSLKEELDSVVNRVTSAALKARAAELGTVEEIAEDGSGNLTIKVRI